MLENRPQTAVMLRQAGIRGGQKVVTLGDFIGKGSDPAKALDMCCEFCEKRVMGNWDALAALVDPGVPVPDGFQKHIDWHRSRLGPDRLAILARLPFSVEFTMSGRKVRLLHASPQGLFYRVFHDDTEAKHLGMFCNTENTVEDFHPDVVGYSDIHHAFQKPYGHKLLFNVGSVGNPLDFPTASYAVITGTFGSPGEDKFEVEIIRLPYDIEAEIAKARRCGAPDVEPYAAELRTAKYRGHKRIS